MDNNLLVLSYNICWGCMTDNLGDTTGSKVVNECIKNKGSCKNNVIEAIDKISKDENRPYDLVGLQEASKYYDIHTNSNTLNPMFRVHAKFNNEEIVSFYNPSKFTLLAVASCDMAILANKGSGRPMLILVLERKSDNAKILFINFHNGHGYDVNILHDAVHTALTQYGNVVINTNIQKKDNIQLVNSDLTRVGDLKKHYNFSEYKIIVATDSNENTTNGNGQYCKGQFMPLFKLGIKKKVYTEHTPLTCCISSLTDNIKQIGDYILYSDEIKPIKDNIVPDFANYKKPSLLYTEKPRSDHLPVYSILSLPLLTSKPPPTSKPPSSTTIVPPKSSMPLKKKYVLKSSTLKDKHFILNNYKYQDIQKPINDSSILIIPNGATILSSDKSTPMVLVMDADYFMAVGYVKTEYIDIDVNGKPKLKTQSKILRLSNLSTDPNSPKSDNFTGPTITTETNLIYPRGEIFKDCRGISYICLVEVHNPANFGLIKFDKIHENMSGGYRKRILNKKHTQNTRNNANKNNKLFSKTHKYKRT